MAKAKLCFSCLRETTCSGSAQIPENVGKMVATAPITHFSIELRGYDLLVGNHRIRPLQCHLSAMCRLPNCSCLILRLKIPRILCDTACSNSWLSNSVADRLGLHGKALKLRFRGINTEEVIDTKLIEQTVKPRENQAFEPFKVSTYVKANLNVVADVININALQETYPYLDVLHPFTYFHANIEMILGQGVQHALRRLEYFAAEQNCSPFACP